MSHRLRVTFAACWIPVVVGCAGIGCTHRQGHAQLAKRAYRISDSFEEERFGVASFSPDGNSVAFTRMRPASSQITNALTIEQVRSDVWVQAAPGERAHNLTKGAADSSGWWQPTWSPDGQRLAMLSSRGGSVALWVWERTKDKLRQVSPLGVDFAKDCRWVDAQRLLCVAMPERVAATPLARGGASGVGRAVELAEAAWARARRGDVTVSALSSVEFKLPGRRLVVLDVATGRGQCIGRFAETLSDGFWLSPDRKTVVHIRLQPLKHSWKYQLDMGLPAGIELKTLDGRALHLEGPLPDNVVTSSLRWSPNGAEVAFFALEDRVIHPELLYGESAREVNWPRVSSKEYPGRLWRADVKSGRLERVSTGDVDLGRGAAPPRFEWTTSGELLFRAPRLTNGARRIGADTAQWLVLGRDGRTRPLTNTGSAVPDALHPIAGGAAFVGILGGDVWRIDLRNGSSRNLTSRFDPHITRLLAIETSARRSYALVSAEGPRNSSEQDYMGLGIPVGSFSSHILDLDSGELSTLVNPGPDASLIGTSLTTEGGVYKKRDGEGTKLWRVSGGREVEMLALTDTFVRNVLQGEARLLAYTSLNGVPGNKAFVVLPVGYVPGKLYPLVVNFDIGYSNSVPERKYAEYQTGGQLSPYVDTWSSAGYMYMFTSAPADAMDRVGRGNLLQITDGVLAATEAAIRVGLADPDRVFVYGGSSAGYGVYALVTQTSRFNAAVANVGWVDQITRTLLPSDINFRYTEYPFYLSYIGGVLYSNSPLPVWRNIAHHRRNSPLDYVDRVQTPLMLVSGDWDYGGDGLTQAEMFFGALVQQRKPAEFVRYWGEGHGNRTPANVHDYWQRVVAWFDKWGDISRDADGNMIWDGDRVKSRNGAPALEPEEFAAFDAFKMRAPSASPARAVPDVPEDQER